MRTITEKKEAKFSFDKVKWFVAIALVVFVVWGNFYFSEANPIYQPNNLVRIAGVVIVSVLALLIASTTKKGRSFVNFAKESRVELRKVVWPTRKETTQTTILVVVITVIIGLCIWGLDVIFIRLISFLTGLGH